MRLAIILSLLILFLLGTADALGDQPPYHYKDAPFKYVNYDENFFGEVFLTRNIHDIEKFREDRRIIKELFKNSNVSAFDLVDFDKLDTVGRTVIIVFNEANKDRLPGFLQRYIPIRPFAGYFQDHSGCGAASYTQVSENNERFLIIKEEPHGKGLAYVLNFLANVQKTASYKNRANCFKPSD
jgi:hypothetical protein